MGQRITPGQKPGADSRYSSVITGIAGDSSDGFLILDDYEKDLGFIDWSLVPEALDSITALRWQNFPESDLLKEKSRTGYVFADYEDDPAVIVIRRIISPKDGIQQTQYRKINGLDGVSSNTVTFPSTMPIVLATDRFIIQQVSEVDEERIGPRYNFGNPAVYALGRSARIYTYGGWLVDNIRDGSAQAQWWVAYNKYMRGSKCAQNKCFAEIYYRDKIRRGYIMHANMSEDSTAPSRAQFAFSFFVTSEASFSIGTGYIDAYDAIPPAGPSRETPSSYSVGANFGGGGTSI